MGKTFNLKAKWKYTEKPFKWEWALLIIICVIFLPTFFYSDITVTTRHSINLWNCIADGESIFNFYAYNSLPKHLATYKYISAQTAAYPFPIYLVFAIWDFPLFLLERFGKINIFAYSAVVFYIKSLLILALLFSAKILKKICKELGCSESKISWVIYIYLSSALVMSCIVIEGQYDIFSVCFSLLGILAYLRNDRRGFIGWFSIAIMFKAFAIIPFIPLLLFKQKKITKIITSVILSALPLLIIKLIFKFGQTIPTASIGLEKTLISKWFSSANLIFGSNDVYLFVLLMAAFCIYCYSKEIDDSNLFKQYTIYIAFISYFIFLVFLPAHPYWFILMAPYLAILMFSNPHQFKLNMLLETIGLSSLFFNQQLRFWWCYAPDSFIPTIIGKKFKVNDTFTPKYSYELLDAFGLKFGFTNWTIIFMMFSSSIFLAAILSFIFINNPIRIQKKYQSKTNIYCENVQIERSVIHTRNIINIIVSLFPLGVFLVNYYKGYLT